MIILGIHFGHNATAVLLQKGKILGCVSEERFNGIKNYLAFPISHIYGIPMVMSPKEPLKAFNILV